MKNIMLQFLFCLLFGSISLGQTADTGGPISWSNSAIMNPDPKQHIMPGFSLDLIQAEDAINDERKEAPWRFGYSYKTAMKLDSITGDWTPLENGSRIWTTEIVCPEALSVNLIFENLFLPSGASLYLYDKNKTNYVGAYTERNNRKDGILGTELVLGNHIVVEYYEPVEAINKGDFTITNVIHGYRSIQKIQDDLEKSLNSAGDCHYDVECPLGNGWEDQIRSIAMIVVNGNGICTGALINNSCEDGRPLMLSANHCLSGGVSSWAFRFNWKANPGTEVCADTITGIDPGPPYDQTMNGATILTNGAAGDFLLMEVDNLTNNDVAAWNLYFSGWNHNDNAIVPQSTILHHPQGDLMKISQEQDTIYHSAIAAAEVWWVDAYEFGSTQGGSSGAPLFDQNKRIIGQLYGGQSNCSGTTENGLYDYFGRLGVSWGYGLSDYLAPNSCGQALVLDGWGPNEQDQFDDASLEYVSSPSGDVCMSTFTPELSIRNAGDNDLTSCTVTYTIDNGSNMIYNWSGILPPNGSESILLPAINTTNGQHVFSAFTSTPNGTNDSNPSNDSITSSFTVYNATIETYVTIETDCFGHETAWELYDSSTTLIGSGGNPLVPPGGNQTASSSNPGSFGNITIIEKKLCLAVGCYDFIIYDDWGDGMEGSSQISCATDGNYTITTQTGFVLDNLQNVNFGNSEINNFCVAEDAGIESIALLNFDIYPNPSSGTIYIALNSAQSEKCELIVRDNSGRILHTAAIEKNFSSIDLNEMADGHYFFTIENGRTSRTKKAVLCH